MQISYLEVTCENCGKTARMRIEMEGTNLHLCKKCTFELDDLIEIVKHRWRGEEKEEG